MIRPVRQPFRIYRVGGSVRDELLGRAGGDRDWVVVGATPEMLAASGFRAVGSDETAAESIGIASTRVKVEAFAVSSFFAGVAGALFAHSEGYIHTNSFGFVRSFELVAFVVLGGLGSLTGAILAAATLTALPEVLRGFGEWRMILYSLLLIATMILRPQGLLRQRELWPISRLSRGTK